jgi:hypothetical protein
MPTNGPCQNIITVKTATSISSSCKASVDFFGFFGHLSLMHTTFQIFSNVLCSSQLQTTHNFFPNVLCIRLKWPKNLKISILRPLHLCQKNSQFRTMLPCQSWAHRRLCRVALPMVLKSEMRGHTLHTKTVRCTHANSWNTVNTQWHSLDIDLECRQVQSKVHVTRLLSFIKCRWEDTHYTPRK